MGILHGHEKPICAGDAELESKLTSLILFLVARELNCVSVLILVSRVSCMTCGLVVGS